MPALCELLSGVCSEGGGGWYIAGGNLSNPVIRGQIRQIQGYGGIRVEPKRKVQRNKHVTVKASYVRSGVFKDFKYSNKCRT